MSAPGQGWQGSKRCHDDVEVDVSPARTDGTSELAERCRFYLPKKKRYCKSTPPSGKQYCVEHAHVLGNDLLKKRIPCPLDPKHTCYEEGLQKHLKKCNSREDLKPVYFTKEVNAGSLDGADPCNKASIRSIPAENVIQLASSVQRLHAEHVTSLKSATLFHGVLREEAAKSTNGVVAQKHIQQQASLIGHMDRLGLLRKNQSFIEFGAGKGGLSHWVQLALTGAINNRYYLVDKGSVRYKMDSYHRGSQQGPSFDRLKIDIEHLDLGKVEGLKEGTRPLVGIGKHLCGGATDLMLRCLMETGMLGEESAGTRTGGFVDGLVLALCCHHRCDWKTYVGKRFFTETCGLSATEFSLICSMTSWATCASRRPEKPLQPEASNEKESHEENYHHPRYGKLTADEREAIGRLCKQLIDAGRVNYLKSRGFEVDHFYYVDHSLTLENMAFAARNKNSVLS